MGIPQVWRINYIQAHLSLSLSGWASLPLLLVTCPIMSSVVPVHFILSQTWTSVRSIIWNKQPIRLTAIIMIIIMTYFRSGQQSSWNILMNFISGESENPQLEYSAITAVYSQTERFRGYSETFGICRSTGARTVPTVLCLVTTHPSFTQQVTGTLQLPRQTEHLLLSFPKLLPIKRILT